MGQIENNFWGLFTLSDVYRTQNWILVNQNQPKNGIKSSLTRRSFNHFAKFLEISYIHGTSKTLKI